MKFNESILNMGGAGGAKPRLKLKDGQTEVGMFQGAFHEFYMDWPKGGLKTVSPDPFPGAQFRFEINFVVKEGNQYVAKVFEGGLRVYKQLAALHKEYDLSTTVFKITRSGTDKQTSYAFMPAKNQPSADTLKQITNVELIPLGGAPSTPSANSDDDSSEVPF